MRPEHRAEQVVASTRRSTTQSRIASLIASLSVRLPASTRSTRRAEHAHAKDVQRLTRHVFGAHVDDALESEQRAGGRRRDAVLAGAGFGDDAALAHALREQRLAERVVDLVRAGVREILALEEQRARRCRRPPARLVERRRPADVRREQRRKRVDERRIAPARVEIRRRQLFDRRHQRLGHEPAAELAEVSARVRIAPAEDRARASSSLIAHRHVAPPAMAALATAAKNARQPLGALDARRRLRRPTRHRRPTAAPRESPRRRSRPSGRRRA